MPRRGFVSRRSGGADPVHGDPLVARMINGIMRKGKKTVAERIVYGSMEIIKDKAKEDPVAVLKKAVENTKPLLEVKSRRVGGATYQVPVEVRPERRLALSLRWMINFARGRSEKTMVDRLSGEILDAYNNRGLTVKKKEDTHKMAEANKAFAHYRW
ncbi:MAG: 30S ribosomal protein S7 [Deltaproteobacteria bacterium]|nr:30S ribosomal protein S7 [Deltaproteobacteria bacterium]MDH3383669.1 30S ribosomal protein S7 [Deltaproteobacteria bacterium]